MQAVAARYSEYGKLLPPNEAIVYGRAGIEKFWKATMDSGIEMIELNTADVEGLGELAVESGAYTLYGKNRAVMDWGKYLVLWKQIDGEWRLQSDC